ncbi:MAG TPA: ATP-dependent RecD-like DNA helicase [Candidatus Scatomonas merdavium]|nr:ATP-dependent RecD-like DNA helicase [Candidatus Scatomonas merdavium]
MKEKIEGYVEHIVYRNDENGYTVLNLSAGKEEITCVGSFQSIHEGEYLTAEGQYTVHTTYGRQFQADRYEIQLPKNGAALERYLGSGAVKGIGAALASRIVQRFGEDTLRIMEEEPERLAEIKGISERKAREIGEQMIENSQMQNAMIFLAQYGISLTLGIKIYNQYQDMLYQVLRENPYKLAEDIQGVGFKIADEIAGRAGIRADSEYRIRSGLFYTLSRAGAEGHLYLPREELLERAAALLGLDTGILDKHLTDLSIDRKIVLKEQKKGDGESNVIVYSSQSYFLELNTARMLQELNIVCESGGDAVEKRIAALEASDGISLDEKQKAAVAAAVRNGLMILTGGPGTGKTTTINTMIRYFEAEDMEIALAAPTGRAAKRMTEATGYEASTIHRLLELSGVVEEASEDVRFERNADHPLEADVIIIDEMSMVDIYLMHALLSAVVPGTRLILVGDMNQLPSVGPGSVLRDIIRSEAFPVVELTHIFRQASESDIVVNAHRIHAGLPVALDNHSRDFFFLRRTDIPVIQKVVLTLVSQKLPRYVDARPQDIQVLCPMRKGPLGVENLNLILQKYLNPPSPEKAEQAVGSGVFRVGDKVMQIRNDYQLEWEIRGKYGIAAQKGLGVFNGDLGVITSINSFGELLTVEYEEGRFVDYTFKQLDELELAYATTIHKAQGSEYPAVVIPLLGGPRMLMTRNLLYTAVTRARKCVVLTGSAETFQAMIENQTEENRYTTLDQRIREAAGWEQERKNAWQK